MVRQTCSWLDRFAAGVQPGPLSLLSGLVGRVSPKDHMVRTASGTKAKVDVVFTRARVAVFVNGLLLAWLP